MSKQEVDLTDSIVGPQTTRMSDHDELQSASNGRSTFDHDRESNFNVGKPILLRDSGTAAYQSMGVFDKEILDAEQVIRTTPTSPAGYLQVGELYSLLGYQQRAMGVYEQGIANVCSQHSNVLRQRYDAVRAKAEQCVDFLVRAPYDIVASIVKLLSLKDRISLLQVSKRWRGQLLEWDSLWFVLEIDCEDEFTTADLSLLQHIAHFVYSISLVNMERTLCEFLLSEIGKSHFSRLEGLSLYRCDIENDRGLLRALAEVAQSLKKIALIENDEHIGSMPFRAIFSTCRSLEYFRYSGYDTLLTAEDAGELETTYTSNLTDLYLTVKGMDLMVVEDVLRCCPSLRNLHLQYCSSLVVKTVHRYCKNLVSFAFNIEGMYDDDDIEEPLASSGLRKLAVAIHHPQNFTAFLTDHATTLRSLKFYSNVFEDNPLQGLVNGSTEFSNLRRLDLLCRTSFSCAAAADILRRSPALVKLHLTQYAASGDEIVNAIIGLPKLKVLDFGFMYSDEQDMRNLFQGLAAKGKELTLREVCFTTIGTLQFPFSTILLEYLPNIPTLQEVDIRNCTVTEQLLNTFCEKMQNHPCIESIRLTNLDEHVTDTTLKHLTAIKTLKYLELTYLSGITEQGLQIFDASPINVSVWNCAGTSDRTAPVFTLSIYD